MGVTAQRSNVASKGSGAIERRLGGVGQLFAGVLLSVTPQDLACAASGAAPAPCRGRGRRAAAKREPPRSTRGSTAAQPPCCSRAASERQPSTRWSAAAQPSQPPCCAAAAGRQQSASLAPAGQQQHSPRAVAGRRPSASPCRRHPAPQQHSPRAARHRTVAQQHRHSSPSSRPPRHSPAGLATSPPACSATCRPFLGSGT